MRPQRNAAVATPRTAVMPKTAPANYRNSLDAVLDLLRFGPAIMPVPEFLVLLFHVEQSTLKGYESNEYSARLATEGMYSRQNLRWLRGPCGVSRTAWHRANRSLVAKSFLSTCFRVAEDGSSLPTSYTVEWEGLANAFDEWKSQRCIELALFDHEWEETAREA